MTVRDVIDSDCDCVNRGEVAEPCCQLGFEVADMGAVANAPPVELAATIWITLAYRPALGPIRSGHGGFATGCRVGESRIPRLDRA